MSRNSVIKAGLPWNFTGSPNSKAMIQNLERNESLITWLQPNDGKITDQFPAICINEQYYTLSLRQMKAGLQMCAFYFYKQAHSQMDSVAPYPPQEELRQPRGRAARRDQAPHSGGPARRKAPHAAALQCKRPRCTQRFRISASFTRWARSCAKQPTDETTRPSRASASTRSSTSTSSWPCPRPKASPTSPSRRTSPSSPSSTSCAATVRDGARIRLDY